MLLESRGIGFTVLCGVLPLGQPTDAGEGRGEVCWKSMECRGSRKEMYFCKEKCSPKEFCWYRAVQLVCSFIP